MLGGWDRETLRWVSMGGRKCRGRKEREDQQEQEVEDEEGEEEREGHRGGGALEKAAPCSRCDDPDCGVRSRLLSSMHTVTLAADADYVKRDPAALVRLLRGTSELRRLSLLSNNYKGADGAQLVQAIGKGLVGERLRCLELPHLNGLYLDDLVKHLQNGQLPFLRELRLPKAASALRTTKQWGKVIATMLAKRKQRRILEAAERRVRGEAPEGGGERWLPLARIEGIASLEPDAAALRRIWRQCQASAVTHLEAFGEGQVFALGVYLQRHHFGALRSLSRGGVRDRRDRGQVTIAGMKAALAQGHAPALEELTLHNWTPEMAGVAPLVQAMPQLVSVTLSECKFASADFWAQVDGLGALGGLRRLQLAAVELDGAGI